MKKIEKSHNYIKKRHKYGKVRINIKEMISCIRWNAVV